MIPCMFYLGKITKVRNYLYFSTLGIKASSFDNEELGSVVLLGHDKKIESSLADFPFFAFDFDSVECLEKNDYPQAKYKLHIGNNKLLQPLEKAWIGQVIKKSEINNPTYSKYFYISSPDSTELYGPLYYENDKRYGYCPSTVCSRDFIRYKAGDFSFVYTPFEIFPSPLTEEQIYVYIERHMDSYVDISLTGPEVEKIECWVKEKIKRKANEQHHLNDNGNEYKRSFTGMLGECAIEKYLGLKFVDWTIGDSNSYHVADISAAGYEVGIKTVELGKMPIVFKKSKKPELICIKTEENRILLCGLATVNVLNTYQDDKFILSPMLKARGTKSGFYGFHKLKHVSSLSDLEKYKIK